MPASISAGAVSVSGVLRVNTATASAQILGSYNPSTASWLWAWANKSILPEMARDSRAIHNWAETHGHHGLARRRIEADDQQTATIAALAVRITRATGFYRGPGSTAIAVITFGTATLTSRHGEVSTFEIKVD